MDTGVAPTARTEPTGRPGGGHRAFWIGTALATGLGLAVRLWFHRYAPSELSFADGLWYHTSANLIADGKGFIDPLTYVFVGRVRETAGHPPLFPFLLAGVSWLGGTSVAAHQYAEIAFDVLAVGAIGLLGREAGGDRIGVLAAFGAALFPRFWASEGDILSESLFALVVAVLLLLAYRARCRRASLPIALALGVLTGLAALTRAEALLFAVLLVLPVLLVAPTRTTSRPRLVLVAAAGTLLVLGPWTAWNTTRFERPVVLSTGLGNVLAGANCATTYHGPLTARWDARCTELPGVRRHLRHGRVLDESVEDTELRDRGLRYVRDHPGRAVLVSGARVLTMLEVYRPEPFSYGPDLVRRSQLWAWFLLVPLAILGAVVARRRAVPLLPFGAALALVVVNAATSWGTPRFRVPLEISMVVLAAFAVDAALRAIAVRRRPRAGAAQPPVISEGSMPR